MNKKILISLSVIAVAAVAAVGATVAYFSSTASVVNNVISTGILQIRVNGQPSIIGMTLSNAAPGDSVEKTVTVMNYGPPWFPSGPSTLAAKEIAVTNQMTAGDLALYNSLNAKVYVNAGWSGCSNGNPFVPGKGCEAYNGKLKNLKGDTTTDLLHATQWGAHPSLAAGNSLAVTLVVEFPNTGGDQSSLQGKSTTFDLMFNAYNPHR